MPDLIGHETSEDCACLPRVIPVKRDDGSVGYVIVHNAWGDQKPPTVRRRVRRSLERQYRRLRRGVEL